MLLRLMWHLHAGTAPRQRYQGLIRSYLCGHPDSFRSVRDLGPFPARCPGESGLPSRLFVRVAPSVAPRRVRSRLRRPTTLFGELAP